MQHDRHTSAHKKIHFNNISFWLEQNTFKHKKRIEKYREVRELMQHDTQKRARFGESGRLLQSLYSTTCSR